MDQDGRLDQLSIFLSYAREDGGEYARRFYARLPERSRRFAPWYDELIPSYESFQRSLQLALSTADVMIVLLTRKWATREWCEDEMLVAKNKKIRIIVAQMHPGAKTMLGITHLSPLDFAGHPRAAWAKLFADLERDASPKRVVEVLDDEGDTVRDRRKPDRRHALVFQEKAERRHEESLRVDDLEHADERVSRRVDAGLRRERTAEDSVRVGRKVRFVNAMPDLPKIKFQDRTSKMRELNQALKRPDIRLVLLTGDGGIGKTALLAEVRGRLAEGSLDAPVTAFVYLTTTGYRQISAATLLDDLRQTVDNSARSVALGRRLLANLSWRGKIDAVLETLGTAPIVVAVDDADELLDESGRVRDRDLRYVVDELIRRDGHRVRLLLVGKSSLLRLRDHYSPRVDICGLDEGLPPGRTRSFLRELDADKVLRVDRIPRADIDRLAIISNGNPRLIELMYFLLRSDPDLSISHVLDEVAPDEGVAAALLWRVLAELDGTECKVVQGLAIYGRPVRPEAIDHLLKSYVTGIDSAPILNRLTSRRLVRRTVDERFFLPPRPDVTHILDTIPPGQADDIPSREAPFTRVFLRLRAADYYVRLSQQATRPASKPGDLQPRFNEIELKIAAGAYGPAIEAMEEIDEEYLTPWGQSGALIRWRKEIDLKIEKGLRLRATNLSYLVSAHAGEEDHGGRWAAALVDVMNEPWIKDAPKDRIRFSVQLADVHMDNGNLASAIDEYGDVARKCRARSMRYEEAIVRTTCGICLARTGRFNDAAAEFTQARRLAVNLDGAQRSEVLAILLLNEGWAVGQSGDGARALAMLAEGLAIAAEMGGELLRGRLLDGQAALYCDDKQAANAIKPATEAADIGLRTGNRGLSRDANVTLALAHLLSSDLAKASAAVHAAAQQPPGIRALGTRAVEGIIHFRRHELADAKAAFHAACTESWLRLQRAPDEYAAYDAAGLALTGLELSGEAYRLPRALDAYRSARAISSRDGAKRRSTVQLELFGPDADPAVLRAATSAASGDYAAPRSTSRP